MPKPRLVSVDTALARAQRQFLRHGYHATSIQTLVDCTGLGRGSIYDTFGSKRGLFITALRHYTAIRHQRLNSLLDRPSPRAAILSVFERTIEDSPDGCFIVNTSVELSPHDPEIAHIVNAALHETEQLFLHLIDRGRTSGEIPSSLDPPLIAHGLLGLYLGLCVLIRNGAAESALLDLVRQATALLK